MTLKVNLPVSVIFSYNCRNSVVNPVKVKWDGREYMLTKTCLHHTYREGTTLFHVFSVSSDTTFFRLVLNTDNLFWQLTEVSENES